MLIAGERSMAIGIGRQKDRFDNMTDQFECQVTKA